MSNADLDIECHPIDSHIPEKEKSTSSELDQGKGKITDYVSSDDKKQTIRESSIDGDALQPANLVKIDNVLVGNTTSDAGAALSRSDIDVCVDLPFEVNVIMSDTSLVSEMIIDAPKLQRENESPPSNTAGFDLATNDNENKAETSFSLDAIGNGEVASLLGKTLDACAQAIDSIVTDLVEDTNAHAREGEVTEASIISGHEGEGAAPSKDEEGWHVLSEEIHEARDEDLARATSMVGSFLFSSDMRQSQEASAIAGPSTVSTVPTEIPSVVVDPQLNEISVSQRQRFASQLQELHSMGITNDSVTVEIMERLTAANIGCGISDMITVAEVCNELFK